MDTIKARLRGMWKSLSVWFNGVVATLLAALPILQESIGQVRELVTADTYKALALALVVGNVLLRFRTTKDLADK